MNLSFSVETKTRIRYSETDQMGYVYYGNYAIYFEMGRVECLRSLGLPYKEMEEQGIMLPVMDLQIEYKAPAKYDDLITIKTKADYLKGSRIHFLYELYNEDSQLLTKGSTTLVFVTSNNMRPTRPSATIIEKLKPFEIHE